MSALERVSELSYGPYVGYGPVQGQEKHLAKKYAKRPIKPATNSPLVRVLVEDVCLLLKGLDVDIQKDVLRLSRDVLGVPT